MLKLPQKIVLGCVQDNWFWHEIVRFKVKAENGWYWASIFTCDMVKKASPLDLVRQKGSLCAFSLAGSLVPVNFDIAKRLTGSTRLAPLYQSHDDFGLSYLVSMRRQLFELRTGHPSLRVLRARQAIDAGQVLSRAKGMTPEEIYFLACYAVQRAEQQKRLEEKDLPARIKKALALAGAVLLEWRKVTKDKVDVIWEILSERFRTTIYEKDLMVFNAGQCLSGGDKEHSLSSLPFVVRQAVISDQIYRTQEADE